MKKISYSIVITLLMIFISACSNESTPLEIYSSEGVHVQNDAKVDTRSIRSSEKSQRSQENWDFEIVPSSHTFNNINGKNAYVVSIIQNNHELTIPVIIYEYDRNDHYVGSQNFEVPPNGNISKVYYTSNNIHSIEVILGHQTKITKVKGRVTVGATNVNH